MGQLKDKALKTEKTHDLTDYEINYIKAMNSARQTIWDEQSRSMSAFLYYLAGSRLGYKLGVDLKFEIDFDSDEKKLKITELPPAKN